MITLKVGPQEEVLQFIIDLGAEKTCIMEIPGGCEVSSDTLEMVGAGKERFEVPIIKDVTIKRNIRIWMGNVLLIPDMGEMLLGKDLEILLGIGFIPEGGEF